MSKIIDMKESQLLLAAKRGYRNWESYFKEKFGLNTRVSQISFRTLSYLAQGSEKTAFYFYDLIMSIKNLGSGFEFNELSPQKKIAVIDHYFFLLDQIRFECMKRLGWLESYPGEEFTLVELITQFNRLAPSLRAEIPVLSQGYPGHKRYSSMNTFDKEVFVRKLVPKVLEEIQGYSKTL